MSSCFNNYYQSINFLESLSNLPRPEYMTTRRRSNFYLNRTKSLIKNLNINLNQFKYIHIAGTSGKGTTTAIVHQVLHLSGKKVGSFYSPHPTTSIERIKIENKYISPDEFSSILNQIKPVLNQMYLSGKYGMPGYFEIFFAIALLYFQQTKCEYVVLETGCGGEFDATNIISRPIITAITNIGLDHTRLLGRSYEKIARTKAGIIKPKTIFITAETKPKLIKIFKNICCQQKAKFYHCDCHQKNPADCNQILASSICRHLSLKGKYITESSKSFSLPCRFEKIQTNPLVILDGAHNYDKLKSTVNNLKKINYNRLYLIFTLNQDKDAKKIIPLLSPLPHKIYLTRHLSTDKTCTDLNLMYSLFLKANPKVRAEIFIDPYEAMSTALNNAQAKDLVLITGSFYLAGELRKHWISEEKILKENL